MRRMRWTKGKKALLAFTFSLTVPFSFPGGIGSGSGPPWRVEQPFFHIFSCLLLSSLKLEWFCPCAMEKEIPIFVGDLHLLLANDHSFLGSNYFSFKGIEFLPRFLVWFVKSILAFVLRFPTHFLSRLDIALSQARQVPILV